MIYPSDFEHEYMKLVQHVLNHGEIRETRNAKTKALFGTSLSFSLRHGAFPLIQGRKMYPNGILGEFAALVRQPKHLKDFETWGCNYWKKWANEDGSINVDYGNAWFEHGQIDRLKDALRNNKTDRRMIINGWRPERLGELSLPCCHYSYQFYVNNDDELYMVWAQRSADVMIGVPADMVLAAIWAITLANELGLKPGGIKMDFGDTHIYESHLDNAKEYLKRRTALPREITRYTLVSEPGKPFEEFEPSDIKLSYPHLDKLEFELYE